MEKEKKAIAVKVEMLDITRPGQTIAFASELSKFIQEKKLAVDIKGKKYVVVEGWQFAGMRFGIIPIPHTPEKISSDDPIEIKYGCQVDLIRIATNEKVGQGYGLCSNKENSKKTFEEYAIVSMAQTRAVGKAYRNLMSWLVKAAGFEPTPYEEIEGTITTQTKPEVTMPQEKKKDDDENPLSSAKQQKAIHTIASKRWGKEADERLNTLMIEKYAVDSTAKLTMEQASDLINWFNENKENDE